MSWTFRRKLFYIFILVLFFGAIGYWIGSPYINKAPTCFDGRKNGSENGVDCGGSCALACYADTQDLKVLWTRAFEVVPGRYNAVAYVENKNRFAAINKVKYRFRFADTNNVYIGQREGEVSIPTAGKYPIFEQAINLGNSVPVYTTFEFLEKPVWIQVPEEKVKKMKLNVSDINLTKEDTTPSLSAKLTNSSFLAFPNVSVVAVLYDSSGDALSVSRTYFEKVNPDSSVTAYFTWPKKLSDKVVSKEIIPMWNFFDVKY